MRAVDKSGPPVAEELAVLHRRIAELEKLEAGRKQAAEEWEATFDSITDLVSIHSKDFRLLRVNKAFADVFKMKPEELIGKTCYKVVHGTNEPVLNCPHLKTQETKQPAVAEFFESHLGLHLEVFTSPLFDDKGGVTACVHVVRDITERKQAEEEARLMALFAKLNPAPVMRFDKDGKVLMANKVAYELFGAALVTGASLPSALSGIEGLDLDACIRKGAIFSHSVEIGDCFFQFVFQGVPDLGIGQVYGSDITERKQAEERLRESEEGYRSLIELGGQIGEAVIMLQDSEQGEGIQTFVNDEWPRITGYSKEELLGMSFFDLVSPSHREASMERHRRKIAGADAPGLFEIIIVRKDGAEIPVELTSAYTMYKGKRANVAFIREVEERKKHEEQIMRTQRLASIGELVAGVAHEINNPLTGIIGFAELVLEKDVPDDIKEDIAIIHHEAKRAAGVIENLLTFAREYKPKKQLINVNSIIAQVVRLRAYEHKVDNIQVTTHFATNLPEVMADASQLQQVFLNIIINAGHAMADTGGKNLTISTEQVGDMARATFTDDGPGISPENLNRIFDPFFTTKEPGKGTGLGLSVCHGMVTEHGGRIYAESELGKGATFVVELPMVTIDVEGGMDDEEL